VNKTLIIERVLGVLVEWVRVHCLRERLRRDEGVSDGLEDLQLLERDWTQEQLQVPVWNQWLDANSRRLLREL
jgi:hypothetical protein